MRNVNARQPGLNSFLDLFTDGKVPDVLSGQIQAGIDLEEFLWLAKREAIYTTEGARSGLGGLFIATGPIVVPPTEAWIVYSWCIETATAASLIAIQTTVYRGAPFPGGRASGAPVTNNSSGYCVARQDGVLFLRPGDQLAGHFLSNPGGASIAFFGFGEIVRIRL